MSDVLFILKESKPLTTEDVYNCPELRYQFGTWDSNTNSFEFSPEKTTTIALSEYSDLSFIGNSFIPITSCVDRMEYAYACMHEDSFVDSVIMDVLPYVEKIIKPAQRSVSDYYLQKWMKDYNFTLHDFIFDNRFIVLHDNFCMTELDKLVKCGFINWDKVEYCSDYELDDENDGG